MWGTCTGSRPRAYPLAFALCLLATPSPLVTPGIAQALDLSDLRGTTMPADPPPATQSAPAPEASDPPAPAEPQSEAATAPTTPPTTPSSQPSPSRAAPATGAGDRAGGAVTPRAGRRGAAENAESAQPPADAAANARTQSPTEGSIEGAPAVAAETASQLDVDAGESLRAEPVIRTEARSALGIGTDERPQVRAAAPIGSTSNPPLTAGTTGAVRTLRSSLDLQDASRPIGRAPLLSQGDPFAPVGIRAGRYELFPSLEQTVGVSSNIDAEPGGESGVFSETTAAARILSDWSRHRSEINASASYRRNFEGDQRDNPRADIDARLDLDLGALTSATIRGALTYQRDDALTSQTGTIGPRPEILRGSLEAVLSRDVGPIELSATGVAAREAYYDQVPGSVDDSNTTLTAGLRAGYRVSPAIRPFVAADLGRRTYDENPFPGIEDGERDTVLPALRGGLAFDIDEKLTGEIALGYAWVLADEDAVPTRGAPTVDANLTWSPVRGTSVSFDATTDFEPGDTPLSSTALYTATLGISRAVAERLTLNASAGVEYANSSAPEDDDTLLVAESGFTYQVNRSFALTGFYAHREFLSQTDEEDYAADTVSLGMLLTR